MTKHRIRTFRVAALIAVVATQCFWVYSVSAASGGRLFPASLPDVEWTHFKAAGFSKPVAGVIFGSKNPTCCGVALGGLGTGCLDIETGGVLGFNAIFNAPDKPHDRIPQLLLPFLGLAVGSNVWVLADQKYIDGGMLDTCTEPWDPLFRDIKGRAERWRASVPKIDKVQAARNISYWGHFPVADLEYDIDAPISVGLRAWSSFIPGDSVSSSIPGAVFELRLRNTGTTTERGILAFSFPGPNWMYDDYAKRPALEEKYGPDWTPVDYGKFVLSQISEGSLRGIAATSVSQKKVGYALGVIGDASVRVGRGLSSDPLAWSKIATELPPIEEKETGNNSASKDADSSVAVDFVLKPGQKKVIRFVLGWYSPHWKGGGFEGGNGLDLDVPRWSADTTDNRDKGKDYVAAYSARYTSALDVARGLVREHESLLRRVLAWQQAVYTYPNLPTWLKDCLVNNLYHLSENSYWAMAKPPLGSWAAPLGAFGLDESPRGCSYMGCAASNWYGDLPVTYFFPELDRMVLRNYREYMRPDGAVPFIFRSGDFMMPTFEWQISLNGPCFVDQVDRLWQRTGDESVLKEFYPAVKKNTIFTMNLKPGPYGVISAHRVGVGQEWWEHTPVQGMVTHLGCMHLAQLLMAERMAGRMGDTDFAKQCRVWFEQGSELLEKHLWAGDYYIFFKDLENGKESNLIMSSQLDGDWAARLHGLPGVVPPNRAKAALDKIWKTCKVGCGLVGFADPKTGPLPKEYGTFPPELNIVGMTYLYHGEREIGMEIIRRNMDNLVLKQRHPWDLPNLIRCDTGARTFGTDYFQNMVLWAAPAAIAGQDLSGSCKKGGLVERIINAGKAQR